MDQVRGNKGFIVVIGVVLMLGILFFLRSIELKGERPQPVITQPSASSSPGWTKVAVDRLTVNCQESGQFVACAELKKGDRMRVVGRFDGMLVVAFDDGRKAVVAPVIDGVPTTQLGEGWKTLPEVSFP